MVPVVVTAGVLLADLARPVSPEEYRRVIGRQALLHEPLSPRSGPTTWPGGASSRASCTQA